jgi:hypothetical protein
MNFAPVGTINLVADGRRGLSSCACVLYVVCIFADDHDDKVCGIAGTLIETLHPELMV